MLFRIIDDLSNGALSLMKKLSVGISRLFDLSTFHLCEALTISPLKSIIALTGARAQNQFPRKQKAPTSLKTFPVKGISLISKDVSSMATMKGGFLVRTDAIIFRDGFIKLSM